MNLHEISQACLYGHLRHAMRCYLPVISALMFYHSLLLDYQVQSENNLVFFANTHCSLPITVVTMIYFGKETVEKTENLILNAVVKHVEKKP